MRKKLQRRLNPLAKLTERFSLISHTVKAQSWMIAKKSGASIYQIRAFLFLVFFWILFLSVAIVLFSPSLQRFEGMLTVEELGFTTTAKNQSIIRELTSVQKILSEGEQSFSLFGKFKSKDYPEIDQVDNVEITLDDLQSLWSLRSARGTESTLEVADLRVAEALEVKQLRYASLEDKLALQLNPSNSGLDQSYLQISLGEESLELVLAGNFQISSSKLKRKRFINERFTISFSPLVKDLKLPINGKEFLSIYLPDFAKDEARYWLGRGLKVKNVQFSRIDKSGKDHSDHFEESTIIQGQVRAAEKEIKIQQKQFLTWQSDDPGITSILGMQIGFPEEQDAKDSSKKELRIGKPSSEIGLVVRFSGEARRIDAGLDKDLPTSNIQSGWLVGKLPSDAITLIIASVTAFVISLFSQILESLSKKN